MNVQKVERIASLTLKLVLLGLLIHAATFVEDLPQYRDKAVMLRIIFYPLASLLTVAVWQLYRQRKQKNVPYPYFVDMCITSVVTFDLMGNALGLYDSIWWWDDAMHLILSVPWVLAAGYLLKDVGLGRWVTAGLVVAYGSTSHIVWELLEYWSFVRGNRTEYLAGYRDTMGDLALSLIGTIVAALITAYILWKPKTKSMRK